MKRFLFHIFLVISFTSFAQKKQNILKKFNVNGMETSILVQENPLVSLDKYKTNTIYDFYQAFKAIAQSDFQHRLVDLSVLKEKSKQSYFTDVLPIAILISEYETIKKEAFTKGSVTNDSDGFLIRTDTSNIFNKHSLNIATVLRTKDKGLSLTFILEKTAVFNTTSRKINKIEIDFNNGQSFRKVTFDTPILINYSSAGTKKIQYRITFNDGFSLLLSSQLEVLYNLDDLQNLFGRTASNFTGTTVPDLSAYGETSYVGEGEYEVFLSTEPNAVLDKPIFIVDGFDPFDRRPIAGYTDNNTGNYVEGIYDLFDFTNTNNTTQNLADLVRAEGFDVIILNFPVYTRSQDGEVIDGGVDFIERNAMLLVDLMTQINNQKTGNEPNVVIGPSMGGLISQYALNYMENQGINHDTRLWIAFDAPLEGANVPIGFQHQFNFLANGLNDFWFIGNQNVEALQPVVNGMMKSNAARQMLVDQLEAHITNSDGVTFNSSLKLPQKHPFYNLFYNSMHALTNTGFPENLRKVSIINGSGLAHFYPDKVGADILPGREIVNVSIDVETGTDAYLDVHFTPYANNTVDVSNVYIDFAWYIPAFDVESDATSEAFTFSHGVDTAAGGLFDLSNVTNDVGTSGIAGEFVQALQTDYFNFIPAVSGMAIEFNNNQTNWFHTVNNANLALETPFDAWYLPTENEPHVTLTQENVAFAWNEIVLQDPASIANELLNGTVKIVNPVKDNLVVLMDNVDNHNLKISIIDINGKLLFSKQVINNSTKISLLIHLIKGVYFVRLQSDDFTVQRKVIVNTNYKD